MQKHKCNQPTIFCEILEYSFHFRPLTFYLRFYVGETDVPAIKTNHLRPGQRDNTDSMAITYEGCTAFTILYTAKAPESLC